MEKRVMAGEKCLFLHVRILFLLLYNCSLTLFKYQLTSDKHIDPQGTPFCSDSNKTSKPARVIYSSLSLIWRACSFSQS